MSEGLIKPQLALSQGPQFSVTSAGEDEKDQECILGTEDYNNNEQLNKFNDLPTLSERNKGEILTLREHTNHLAQEKGKHQSQAGTNHQVKSGKLKEGGSRDCELQSRVETAGQFELTATGQSALSEAEHQEELEQNQYEWAEKRGEQHDLGEITTRLTAFKRKGELLRGDNQERVSHLQSRLEIIRQEFLIMREQTNELEIQSERLRWEHKRVIQLQSLLDTNGLELAAMREELIEFHKQEETLREKQQRVTELQSQLKENENEWAVIMEQLNRYQGQKEQLKKEQQRVTEMESQLEIKLANKNWRQ